MVDQRPGPGKVTPRRRLRPRWAIIFLTATVLAGLATWQGLQLRQQLRRDEWLKLELAQRITDTSSSVRCSLEHIHGAPLRLLVLGQSNAGNHGPRRAGGDAGPALQMQIGSQCVLAHDPLPGASGDGSSIWTRLPPMLNQALGGSPGLQRSPQIALLSLQSTTLDDWSRPSSPLNQALQEELSSLRAANWVPDLVLWQQGEADALSGTSADDYIRGWTRLLAQLQAAGVHAPVLLARSTHCERATTGAGDTAQRQAARARAIREAIQTLTQQQPQLRLGPDTDALAEPRLRRDGCHFSGPGLEAAARLWSEAIAATLQPTQP